MSKLHDFLVLINYQSGWTLLREGNVETRLLQGNLEQSFEAIKFSNLPHRCSFRLFKEFLLALPTYFLKEKSPTLHIYFPEMYPHSIPKVQDVLQTLTCLNNWNIALGFNGHSSRYNNQRILPQIGRLQSFIYYNNHGRWMEFSQVQQNLHTLSLNTCYECPTTPFIDLIKLCPALRKLGIHVRAKLKFPEADFPKQLTHISFQSTCVPQFLSNVPLFLQLEQLVLTVTKDEPTDDSKMSEDLLKKISEYPKLHLLKLIGISFPHQNLQTLSKLTSLNSFGLCRAHLNQDGIDSIPLLPSLTRFEWEPVEQDHFGKDFCDERRQEMCSICVNPVILPPFLEAIKHDTVREGLII